MMIKEYALDPGILSNWKDFRYFIEKFGIENGRLISRYPKNWTGRVKETIKGCRDIEYLRIVDRLENIDDKLCRRHHEWCESKSWINNAEEEHAVRPFHAIVAENNPLNHSFVLVGDEVDERNALWKAEIQEDIPRNPNLMANAASLLLQQSKVIIFIDPHFSPQEARFRRPLKAFLEVATRNRTTQIKRVSYYLKAKSTLEYFKQECNKHLKDLIPERMTVGFIRLHEKVGGEKLHDRYIITERGGIGYTVGLDDGNRGEHTGIALLSGSNYKKTWNDYLSDDPSFEIADETNITGCAITT